MASKRKLLRNSPVIITSMLFGIDEDTNSLTLYAPESCTHEWSVGKKKGKRYTYACIHCSSTLISEIPLRPEEVARVTTLTSRKE